jgi:hypothetical protein
MNTFSPREIVSELERYIVGQNDAKRAVAIALRNRWRRQQLEGAMKEEVLPKNILMIGPTGCGKTEISRRGRASPPRRNRSSRSNQSPDRNIAPDSGLHPSSHNVIGPIGLIGPIEISTTHTPGLHALWFVMPSTQAGSSPVRSDQSKPATKSLIPAARK